MALIPPNGVRKLKLQDTTNYNNSSYSFPAKDPNEELNYSVDFSAVIESSQGLSSIEIVFSDNSLILVDEDTTTLAQGVIIRLRGGTIGCTSNVNLSATFADGEVYTTSILMPVIQKFVPPPLIIWSYDFSQANNSGVYAFW